MFGSLEGGVSKVGQCSLALEHQKGPETYHIVGIMSARSSELLKEGTRHLQGVDEAVIRNIEAIRDLAKIVRTSLGPQGM